MPKLPIVCEILPDELLYSYLLRLSRENKLDDIRNFTDHYVFSSEYENKGKKYVAVSYDIRDDLYQFAKSVTGNHQNQVLSFYLKTSLFHGFSPLYLRSRTSHYVGLLSKYRNHSKLLSPAELMVQQLNLCPECQKAEEAKYGFFYYHRAHQMPGVTACHLHGCALLTYNGKTGKEMELPLKTQPLPTYQHSVEYARFCKEFLDAELECDMSSIADAISKRVSELEQDNQTGLTLSQRMEEYLDLMKIKPEHLIRFLRQKDQLHIPSLLTLLLYLFGNVSTMKKYIPKRSEWSARFRKKISAYYTLLSPWREDIMELQCNTCGALFLSTPHRIRSAWGCPVCDGRMNDQTLFKRLFRAVGYGSYDLLSEFQGMGEPILVKHRTCGKEYLVTAKEFLEHYTRCQCNYALTEADVRKQIENLGDFELQSYENSMKPIKVFHKSCKKTFHVMFHMFMKTPRCRICQRLKADHSKPEDIFIKNVTDLVGDEYTVLEKYVSSKTPIEIRHNSCGTVQKYAPKHFLDGQRCKVCRRRISDVDFEKIVSQVSLGRYECVNRIPPCTAVIRDTVSGEEKSMTVNRALQELYRPTPSPLLPLKKRDLNVAKPINQKDRIMDWLNTHYALGDEIVLRALQIDGLEHSSVKNGIAELAESGKLKRIKTGIYTIPHRE